jgi:hypothetical protein
MLFPFFTFFEDGFVVIIQFALKNVLCALKSLNSIIDSWRFHRCVKLSWFTVLFKYSVSLQVF